MMKKLLIPLSLALLIMAGAVIAGSNPKTPITIDTGNADYECVQAGFDFGIAKWEWNDEDAYELAEEGHYPGFTTSVTGDDSQAYWTSSPAAAGVLSKEATDYFLLAGGASGTIDRGDHEISHVTLCGNDVPEDVPEFGVFAALGVLGLAGLFIYKKRNV